MGVSGSDFSSFFQIENIHFHWGYNDFQGSEHRLNGQKMPMEMHVVHASDEIKNYVVTGFFFQISKEDNKNLEPLLSTIDKLKSKKSTDIEFNIFSIYPSVESLKKYYRYSGGLTTPPCSELVTWNLFKTPINISSKQIKRIRDIGPFHNFRSIQPLNDRIIYNSYNKQDSFKKKKIIVPSKNDTCVCPPKKVNEKSIKQQGDDYSDDYYTYEY